MSADPVKKIRSLAGDAPAYEPPATVDDAADDETGESGTNAAADTAAAADPAALAHQLFLPLVTR